jgi:hypothetical protein
VREILPGLFHWTALHPKIRIEVSSYYVLDPGVLLDPLLPPEGLEWFAKQRSPDHVILTNRHHYRHSARFAEAFGCTVWCRKEGLHEFTHGEQVEAFSAGHVFTGGIESHPIGVLCPDETALRIPVAEGVLAVADGVVRDGEGPLSFVPDALIADTRAEAERVKKGLKAAYARLLELDWDHLLLAHGTPWIGGAKNALRAFVEA